MTKGASHLSTLTCCDLPSTPQSGYNMGAMSGIEKHYTKVNIHEQKSDFAHWQTQPYQARLAALEQIRREYHKWRYGAEPRIEKVYTIVKMPRTEQLQDLADLENLA
ncbi:MAG: hypothetical protein U9R15_11960 [Chloroflexota bacterium]|nr:hypothetical protein [Chloroflexota bacterium]